MDNSKLVVVLVLFFAQSFKKGLIKC